jgi:hypothetical protein
LLSGLIHERRHTRPPIGKQSWNDIGSGTGPAIITASPRGAANEFTPLCGASQGANDYSLDDVAKLLYDQDLQRYTPAVIGDFDTSGRQNVTTYTVGFGINSNLLLNTAAGLQP